MNVFNNDRKVITKNQQAKGSIMLPRRILIRIYNETIFRKLKLNQTGQKSIYYVYL